MVTTPFLHGAAGEQKQRGQGDGSAKNVLSPASQGPKKPPRRGSGVFQLEQRFQREQWKKRTSGDQGPAAASSSDLPPLPPSFLDPLTGPPIPCPLWHQQVGAYSPAAGADSIHFWLNPPTSFGAFSGGRGGGMAMPDQAAVAPYNPSNQVGRSNL